MTKEENDLWWLGLTVGILELMLAFWASQQYIAPSRGADPDLGRLHGHVPWDR